MSKQRTSDQLAVFSFAYFVLAAISLLPLLFLLDPRFVSGSAEDTLLRISITAALFVIAGIGTLRRYFYAGYVLGNILLAMCLVDLLFLSGSGALAFRLLMAGVICLLLATLNAKFRRSFVRYPSIKRPVMNYDIEIPVSEADIELQKAA